MKSLLCSVFLVGCLAFSQQPERPAQPPPLSTPPTFPQGQPQPQPDTMPPDTRAPAPQNTPEKPGNAGETRIEGCLSGTEGNYVLTDSEGNAVQLQGDTSELAKHVGERVRITGTPTSPASTSGEQENRAEALNTMSIESVKTVAKTCTPSQSVPK